MTREEAIQIIRETYHTDEEMKALESLIPELADSEDEKTRKELIFFLKEEVPMCSIKEHAEKLKKFVSYLERQKEQKPAEWSKEDEAHRKFISESLEDQIRFCKKDAEGAYYTKQIRTAQNWLNDLPNKFNSD